MLRRGWRHHVGGVSASATTQTSFSWQKRRAPPLPGIVVLRRQLLCPLALVNVDKQVVPADDVPFRTPKRKSARLKPAVDAIERSARTSNSKGSPDAIEWLKSSTTRGRSSGCVMPPVPERLSSSIVPAEVLEDLAVDDSTSPLGVKAATNPGMQSTIRRGSRSLSRSASLAMASSRVRAASSAADLTGASMSHLRRARAAPLARAGGKHRLSEPHPRPGHTITQGVSAALD